MQFCLPSLRARLSLISAALLLSACATPPAPARFDLGPLPSKPVSASKPNQAVLKVADVQAVAWLDGAAMFYRLSYANAQQTLPYAQSRWSMPPAQLIGQRLKNRLAQAGYAVAHSNDSIQGGRVLRVELDEFIQDFSQAQRSQGQVKLRASLIQGRQILAQRSFAHNVTAPSADAVGGALALAQASDLSIEQILQWLAEFTPTQ